MTGPERILITDDDPQMQDLLVDGLAPLGYEVALASTGREALECIATGQYNVTILDLMLPDLNGIEVLRRIREQQPEVEVVVLTGHASLQTAVEALRIGASDYVTKPYHLVTIQSAIRRAIEKQRFRTRLAALNRATQAMVATLDPDEVLTLATAEARTMLHAEATAIYLLDEATDELYLAAVAGSGSQLLTGSRSPADVGVAGWVARDAEAVLIPDVHSEPRFSQRVDGLVEPSTTSLLAVPLKCRGTVIGVLEAANKPHGEFDEHERELLSTLAGSAAIAVTNARLYQAEREMRRLLEQSQMQLVQSEKLAATGRLAASLAHEINNPLQAIHNSLQLMLAFELEAAEQREYLQIADEEIERLMGMVTSILDFARPPQREMQPTDVNATLSRVLTLASKYLQHRGVALKRDLSDGLPLTLAAPDELEQVFINLVLNAVDAMPRGGKLLVSSQRCDDGRLAVAFTDTGCGIPEEHLERIFEPFFSTKEEGTGLGLTVSHNVVEHHGGEITVESTDGGTTFTVWLPTIAEGRTPKP